MERRITQLGYFGVEYCMADFEEHRYKVDVLHEGDVLGEVSVVVARPKKFEAMAIMAHGAGGDMNAKLLVQLQEGLAGRAVGVVRFNFLYSEKRKRAPDRRPLLEAAWRSVADWSRKELESEAIFLGGKSMGGRMASYVAADGYPCRGVFFLGYPLHPPGRTDKQRRDHLPSIKVPTLFIQGARDSFAKLELLQDVLKEMKGRATLHVIDGGDHSFKLPKRLGRTESEVTQEILDVLVGWMHNAGENR